MCEPAGDAYIARQHTDTSRGAAHRYLEQTFARATAGRFVRCEWLVGRDRVM